MWLNKLSMPVVDISNHSDDNIVDASFKELFKSIKRYGMEELKTE